MRNSQVKKTILPINRTETLPLPTPKLLPSLIKHPWVMPYNRLAFLMVTINICVYLLYQHSLTIPDISWLIIGNFALAIFTQSYDHRLDGRYIPDGCIEAEIPYPGNYLGVPSSGLAKYVLK